MYESLGSLGQGEGWVANGEADFLKRIEFPPIATLDVSQTPESEKTKLGKERLVEIDAEAIGKALERLEEGRTSTGWKPTKIRLGDIGEKIRQVRIRDGKSQLALAEAMETDQNHISRLERGEVSPTLQTLEKIAAATDHGLQVEFVMRPIAPKKRRL